MVFSIKPTWEPATLYTAEKTEYTKHTYIKRTLEVSLVYADYKGITQEVQKTFEDTRVAILNWVVSNNWPANFLEGAVSFKDSNYRCFNGQRIAFELFLKSNEVDDALNIFMENEMNASR